MIENIALIIYIVGMSAMILLALFGRVDITVMFIVSLIPLQNVLYRMHLFPMGKDLVDIVLAAMIIGWIVRSVIKHETILEPTPLNTLLIVMAVYTYFSLWQGAFYLNEPAPLSASNLRLQTWKNYMILPLIYFLTVNNIKTTTQMKWLLLFMALTTLIMDYYTIKQIMWSPSLASRDKLIGTTMWLGPNQVAAFYIQCIFILIGLLLTWKDFAMRVMMFILLAVSMYVMLFMYSRGAYVALITGMLAISIIRIRALILPLILLLMFWQAILPKTVIDRIKETHTEEGALDSSSRHRLELWEESLSIFQENPITGVGFDVIYHRGLLGRFKDTHNIFMKVLAEEGIIGALIFIALFWKALASGYRLYRDADDEFLKGLGLGFAACVVGTLTTNMFGDRWTFMQIIVYFWVILGMVQRGLIINTVNSEQLTVNNEG
ncbi:MAG: hypothetical protein A2219_06725 [Elusimicrobia bacterium RIFOXYA2_FULL_50_26]|nr:MAG: hypothetical protein A2219_06725 [Elusimicrobia bacterium RIFOXYA2_FULL_50_26]